MFIFQVQIYSSSTHQVIKSFSRFKDGVFSGSFRHDGKLIIAGEANGHVQVLVFSNLNCDKQQILLFSCNITGTGHYLQG